MFYFRHLPRPSVHTGHTFLRQQVNNLVVQHASLLSALRHQEREADAQGYRAMCARCIPLLERHQKTIREYADAVGVRGQIVLADSAATVPRFARDLADAFRRNDFENLVADIAMIRHSQDLFGVFARAGERLGERRLAELGRSCEKDHDLMQREFNDYLAVEFIAQVRRENEARTSLDGATSDTPSSDIMPDPRSRENRA